ncbi:MAG TPA: alpha/beta fold hydrolase [Solirubrobacteraceae bacterium]|jgi:alpha-beta hydrolase superfamily lysophospholipase|nr:alpha/beta fold hydrolase [Solirubrobacteraceae bacterium]
MTTTREDLRFTSDEHQCAAWLYPAADTSTTGAAGSPRNDPAPLIVMAHGLSGTRRDRLGPFAERFAAAGVAALVFDHRGFGDSGGEPDLFDPALQLEDWRAAIAFGRSLPGIDAERVATFGSSMGGGNALAAAAGDRRIAAAISQVPFLDVVLQTHRSSPRVTAKVLAAAARGRHLPVLGEPHEPALLNAPGAAAGWRHVVAIGEDSGWRDRVSTQWLLGRPYRPARKAAKLHCPWLVCVGEADRLARPGPAIAAARRAPLGELRTYPGVDHFDVYDGPAHEALVADQLEFLRRHLLGAQAERDAA